MAGRSGGVLPQPYKQVALTGVPVITTGAILLAEARLNRPACLTLAKRGGDSENSGDLD